MSYLLDTNTVSEVRKPAVDANVGAWFRSVQGEELYLSVLVIGEIRQGIQRLRRRDPAQAEVYERWLSALKAEYADRILPVTEEIVEEWGRLNAGGPLPVIDGLMAATARVLGMTVVTRNTADFARMGVPILNPFLP